jgi:hypothetical protein
MWFAVAVLQALARPSADVFLGADSEASLVVVPLQLGPNVPYKAALYVLHNKPGNFSTAKRPICVLASMLQLLLHRQLQEGGLLTEVWADAHVQSLHEVRDNDINYCKGSEFVTCITNMICNIPAGVLMQLTSLLAAS